MAHGDWQQRAQAWLLAQWQRPVPGPALRALLPLAWGYGALVALRRRLYRAGLLRTRAAARPVIVVGNLVAGGAGKTPAVIALIELLRRHGHVPGVISRGHGRHGRGVALLSASRRADAATAVVVGDEPLLIHRRTRAPVAVAPRRIDAARALCATHPETTVLVADDGLQHLALDRQVQLILFDDRGAGNGWLLPAGPLREPMPPQVDASTLVVYTHGRPSTALPGCAGTRAITGFWPLAAWWQGDPGPAADAAALQGREIVAAAGLARPAAFFAALQALGLRIRALPLPDHADFGTAPWPAGTAEVVVTEKDAVKLDPDRVGATRVWVARLDFSFPPEFAAALMRLLPATHHAPAPADP